MAGPVAAFTIMYNAGVIVIFFFFRYCSNKHDEPRSIRHRIVLKLEQDLQGVFYWTPSKKLCTEISLTGHPQKS